MATTKKKVAKKPKAKANLRRESRSKGSQSIEAVRRERDEALEQFAAASHILHVIASSPTDIQPVLDDVAENAARLCAADDAQILRIEGDVLRRAASYGSHQTAETRPITREIAAGRAVIDQRTVHVHDIRAAEDQGFRHGAAFGYGESRTLLAVPLLRESISIGVILIRRFQVRPFSDNQITLLKTFADQAVIAIENVRLFNELKEALEQQTATREILGVIASSPTNIQPVLDAVAESAARLCEAKDAVVYRLDGDVLERVAIRGPIPIRSTPLRLSRGTVSGRAVVDRQTVHIHDIDAESETEFPDIDKMGREGGSRARTRLAVPLLREGVALGAILIRRMEVRPFTDKQVALLQTFADQAVIAIENVRLFEEIQERNAELREALEHQTATAEVLGIISRSPTDVQPVLEAIVESAARVCGIDDLGLRLREGNNFVSRAHFGPLAVPVDREEVSIDDPRFRWIAEHGTLHIPDTRAQNDFPWLGLVSGARTFLLVPLRQQGEVVGTLGARRTEVRPFTPAQIKLLETFANQAVIALENIRLFQELKESLEQQTATSEILGVIASSPTDIQPVLDTIAKNAAQVCGADDAAIRLVEKDGLRLMAHHGSIRIKEPLRPIDRDSAVGRAVFERAVIHHEDLLAIVAKEYPVRAADIERLGIRTMLAAPLMRENQPIGVIIIRRTVVQPFSEKQISLLKTFASQAVIAIENVRLFKEIQERNAELREALEHQTATSEVLAIISRSPTDVQPVLDAIVESAARVCGIDDVVLRFREGAMLIPRAHFGPIPITRVELSIEEPWFHWIREHGTLHVPDVRAQNDLMVSPPAGGWRTGLSVPLRQQGEVIGLLNARRTEVHPFTPVQIRLLETFADQAVIAIENVRLFKELQERNRDLTEALEQQTATSAVLRVISSSPTDLQPVFETILANATRLCDAKLGALFLYDGEVLTAAAHHNASPSFAEHLRQLRVPPSRDTAVRLAALEREVVHVTDILTDPRFSPANFPLYQKRVRALFWRFRCCGRPYSWARS
jgi:two-component system, NtrC family, sensor kinase